MLDGDQDAVAASHGIDLAHEAPTFARDLERSVFGRFIVGLGHLDMQSTPGIDSRIGRPDFFDFLQIEESFDVIISRVGCNVSRSC
jgi:hypothetical protein